MASEPEYALMAGATYTSTRSEINRIPWPYAQGWDVHWPETLRGKLLALGFTIEDDAVLHRSSGFEARIFSNGVETVIAFAGTDIVSPDTLANIELAAGAYNGQLERAALLHAAVRQLTTQTISFTGHSLGGGLAALMGVYFNKVAVTFDQAPFQAAAIADHHLQLQAALERAGFTADPDLASYEVVQSLGATQIRGAHAVRSISVDGEFLSVSFPFTTLSRIGAQTRMIDLDDAAVASTSSLDLHAQSLLILVQHSAAFVTRIGQVPTLLPSLFDNRFFDRSTDNSRDTAILEHFIRHEFGVPGTAYVAGDGLFTSFVNELAVLAEPGVMQQVVPHPPGLPTKDFQHAINLVLQQHYYRVDGAFDPAKTLLKAANGGWYFDVNAVTGASTVSDLLAGHLLADAIGAMYDGGATKFASPALTNFDRLHWQAGEGAFSASGTATVDLMLGGAGGDTLGGDAGNDLLLGGAGADTLDGGTGTDTLIGGGGDDVYRFAGAFGHDTIEDSDGAGQIEVDGSALPTGKKLAGQNNAWVTDNGAFTYVFAPLTAGGSVGTLYVLKSGSSETIAVRNFAKGQLGIELSDEPATVAPPANAFSGDFPKKLDASGTYYVRDGFNYVPDPGSPSGAQPDLFLGTADADRFTLGEGNDGAMAGDGADWIEGGGGGDLLFGGAGDDTINGGDGSDFIFGSHTGSWSDAPVGPGSPLPVAAGPELGRGFGWVVYDGGLDGNGIESNVIVGVAGVASAAGDRNLIDGGAGNDAIGSGSAGDLAFGGAGDDRIFGMGGDDVLLGGEGDDRMSGDGPVLSGYLETTPAEKHGADVLDGGGGHDLLIGQGGADVLIGGDGNDRLWGDDGNLASTPASIHGNDSLDGGAGSDELTGGGGNDELHGGSEDDLLVGDDMASRLAGALHGDDYLDGEGGSDHMQGSGGSDVLFGGNDNDQLFGDDDPAQLAGSFHGNDYLDGEDGDDYLEGGGRDDDLFGGNGNDMLWGDSPQPGLAADELGDDYLDGGDGNDSLEGGGRDDTLFGGAGSDQLRGDGDPGVADAMTSGADYLDGGDGDDSLRGDGGDDVLYGGAGNDQLLGDSDDVPPEHHGADFLDGEAGDDRLFGGGGDDLLFGGADNDQLLGDDTDIPAQYHGADLLDGGDGTDLLVGGGRGDTLYGGAGADTLYGDTHDGALDEAAHGADFLDGGSGDDFLFGDGGADVLLGGPGNDQILGDNDGAIVAVAAHGADAIDGGEGNDVLRGDGGGDTLYGGEGNDTLFGDASAGRVAEAAHGDDVLDGGAGADTVFGGGGSDSIAGGDGDDWLVGDDFAPDLSIAAHGDDEIHGGAGNDHIDGGGGADRLFGGEGNDMLLGDIAPNEGPASAHGDDLLDGGAGDDNLTATGGNDTLIGGSGNDALHGGDGNDTYLFNRGDGADVLDNTDSSGGIDVLRFGAGIIPDDILGQRSGNSLVLLVAGTADRITLRNWYVADSIGADGATVTTKLDRIEFAGGAAWTTAEIAAAVPTPVTLYGGAGPDTLSGGTGDDLIYGNGGSDELSGGRGKDLLDGGAGADLMLGGRDDDSYSVDNTADRVIEELSAGGGDFDFVQSSVPFVLPKGVETLSVSPTNSSTDAKGTGNALGNTVSVSGYWAWPYAYAYGLGGNDYLHGAGSHDALYGGSGNDYLNGGAGRDTLVGGTGDDWYVVDSVDDVVTEYAGEGYDYVESSIAYVLPAHVEAVGLDSDANLSITGNDLDNYIGGGRGDNVLTGGKGNDYLSGWLGNDTYVFSKGDGHDVIANYGDATYVDKLQLGSGIAPADVAFNRVEDGLLMSIFGGADSVFFLDWFSGDEIDAIRFSSGLSWSPADVDARLGSSTLANSAPQVHRPDSVSVTVYEGQEVSFAFPPGVVSDADPWDAFGLAFDLTGAGGDTPEPGWLGLEATGADSNGVGTPYGFVGTPNYGRAGTYEYLAQWRDVFEATVSIPVTITVLPAPPNRAPEVIGEVTDVEIPETAGSVSSTAFLRDPDGDPITYLVTQADGGALPPWLSVRLGGSPESHWIVQVTPGAIEGGSSVPVRIVALDDSGARSDPVEFTVRVLIEDLVLNGTVDGEGLAGGSGNDRLYGLAGSDYLFGNAGNDLLDGGPGADTMSGGTGNDTYVVDATGDAVVEDTYDQGGGRDLVLSAVNYTLPSGIEDLTLTGTNATSGTGNALDNVLTGNAAGNTLTGGAGNDVLDGRGGADKLIGGAGDDRYVVDATGDAVTEKTDEGIDTVEASVSYTLAGNVERLILAGGAAINGTGNTLANEIVGNGAANVLNGGTGADRLLGGAGNDTYVVDNAADEVIESAGEGTDLVQASVTWALGEHVENLTLTGSAAISGFGNALDNVLTGNSANNALVGGPGNDTLDGGGGSDTLTGGAGDDTYVVNATGDVVNEQAGEGTDTVRSSVTWTLGASLENLVLTGTGKVNGTGNAAANQLTGNTATNTLTGGAGNDTLDGGAGADVMAGGAGDDRYVVDSTSDKVNENAGEGTDSVQSAVTWTLTANVEHLTLAGTAAINGAGNALANRLQGNAASNVLNGAAGNDLVQGAGGNDAVTDTSGSNALDGGEGTDALTGGSGREFFAGGPGNDTLTLGGGADIVAFNRGHGADVVNAPASGSGLNEANDTVSLGGVRYGELRLARSGADLLLKIAGTGDSLKFVNWYANAGNATVSRLQFIVDSTADYVAGSADPLLGKRVAWFDFPTLLGAFNAAYAANPAIGDWTVPAAILGSALSAASDTQAFGGELAHRHGHDGNLDALDFDVAVAQLGDAGFAVAGQAFGLPLLPQADADPFIGTLIGWVD